MRWKLEVVVYPSEQAEPGNRQETDFPVSILFDASLYTHKHIHERRPDRVGGPGFSLSDVHSARSMENNALFFAEKKARLLVLLLVCVCLSVSVCGTSQLFGPQNLTGWQSHLIPGHNQTQNTTGDPLPALAGGAQHVDLAAGPHPVARARAHPRYGFHSLYDDAPNPMLSRKGPPFFLNDRLTHL